MHTINKEVVAVDLFCGIGGLTHGLEKAGVNVVAGLDCDTTCEYAYNENNNARFIPADVSTYPASDIKKLFGNAKTRILVGCAPCQTFSAQSRKIRKQKDLEQDPRWTLLNSFATYIEEIQPEIVSMENVPELRNFNIFKQFCERLEKINYSIDWQVVDCAKYGLPQKRRRLVLLASKYSNIKLLPYDSVEFARKRTVRDVLGNLPALDCGQMHEEDNLHRSAGLTAKNLERIKHSKQGGTWRDWPEHLMTECHKKDSGKDFTSVYGRMRWDEPSPTITTQFFYIGAGRYGHPDQHRAISLREGALLQTFPQEYKFFKDYKDMALATISRHIGNAVPVDLGKIIGLSIKKHLEEVEECQKNKRN
jgi:DNA (cytosine-5)-methyltransferase 1